LWLVLPTVPVQTARVSKFTAMRDISRLKRSLDAYCEAASRKGEQVDWSAADLFQKLIDDGVLYKDQNPYTGKLSRERSPGNIDVRKMDGVWYACTYDADGIEHRLALKDSE